MRHFAVLSFLLLATLSCSGTTADDVPNASTALGSAAMLSDLSVSTTGLVSIFATYSAHAPADRMHQAFVSGTRVLGDSRRHHQLTMVVAASVLSNVLARLRSLPWVGTVEVDSVGLRAASSAPTMGNRISGVAAFRRRSSLGPWGILFTGAHAVDSAVGNTGSGVKIGLIDSGVDCSNNDISGRIVGGYDFANGVATGCSYDDAHGSAVAGIIAGTGAGPGVVGMAPGASLYSYRVQSAGLINTGYLQWALDSAIAAGVKVINLSIVDCGTGEPSGVTNAIADAVDAGIVVVAAAGNGYSRYSSSGCGVDGDDSLVSQIARQPGVVAVSAFDTTYAHDVHGQYGPSMYFSGPEDVKTDSVGSSGTWSIFSGTSAAAPHVTGAVALALHAGYTASGALSLLESYPRPGPGQTMRDNYYGFGEIYVGALLAAPSLDSVRYCTSGNYNIVNNDSLIDGHNCVFRAWTSHGAPPVEAKFKVITSVVHDTTIYDWGPQSQEIDIPPTIGGIPADSAGYTMTVVSYARDSVLQRGTDSIVTSFYVCNVSAGIELRTPPHPSWGRGGPDLPAGCSPGGDLWARSIRATAAPVPVFPLPSLQTPATPRQARVGGSANGVWPIRRKQ